MKKTTLILSLFCFSLFAQENNFSIKNLDVNTNLSDFGTTYMGDSIVIYASTKRLRKTIRKRIWNPNQQRYLELFLGELSDDGEINNSKYFSNAINTKYHESNVTFTKDLKTVYFTRDNFIRGKKPKRAKTGKDKGWVLNQLYKARVAKNGEWRDITPMPFNSDEYQTGHPSLNITGDKLYFISDMPGGYGMTDVYVVDITPEGTYGIPQNLGPKINTSKREMFPFISENNILYFSSDGQSFTHGKLDIYASKKDLNDRYVEPVNLGQPLNSNRDDFGIVFKSEKKSGHFSSNRFGGKGDDDIYSFKELKPIFEENCIQIVKGVIRDKKRGSLLPKSIVTLFKKGEKEESVIVGSDAFFTFEVDCETNYNLVGEKKGYNPTNESFVTSSTTNLELNLELILSIKEKEEFIRKGEKVLIKINPIYFDLDKFNIRPDAEKELNTVIKIMRKYPKLIIEGGSYTDSRGNDSYNQKLSTRRAESTIKFLIEKGVNPSRVSAKGYGESLPVNRCVNGIKCSELEHQLNRRTEFVIKNPKVIDK